MSDPVFGDRLCIHELHFNECALCSSSDWHQGLNNSEHDALLFDHLVKIGKVHGDRKPDLPPKERETVQERSQDAG